MKNEIIVYQNKSGAIAFKGDYEKETLWANQSQIADLFGVERSVATKHIRNILKDKELNEDSVCADFAHTADDGKTYRSNGVMSLLLLSAFLEQSAYRRVM